MSALAEDMNEQEGTLLHHEQRNTDGDQPRFRFRPMQYVKIRLYGLNLKGRVMRCIWDGEQSLYDCDYADVQGELRRREFYVDELEAV